MSNALQDVAGETLASLNQSVNYAFGRERILQIPVLRDHKDSLAQYATKKATS